MPRFPSAQGRLNHEPDSTLAVTKTCPKDGVHLFLMQVASLYSFVATPLVSAIVLIALGVFFVLYWCYLRCYFSTALTNRVKHRLESQ